MGIFKSFFKGLQTFTEIHEKALERFKENEKLYSSPDYIKRETLRSQFSNFISENTYFLEDKVSSNKKFHDEFIVPNISEMEKNTYQSSSQWYLLKEKRLKIADFKCEFCSNKNNLELHHETYINLMNENINDLKILCRNCHQILHDKLGYQHNIIYEISQLKDIHILKIFEEINEKMIYKEKYNIENANEEILPLIQSIQQNFPQYTEELNLVLNGQRKEKTIEEKLEEISAFNHKRYL